MTISENCIDLVKRFEGCRLSAYSDPGGIPTIGYGHTLNVQLGMSIMQDQADEFLRDDLERAADRVESCLTIVPNQNQFDALVSFEFNTGALKESTLARRWNQGNVLGAANQFECWTMGRVNGKMQTLPGLVLRRAAEKALFLTP
jgi:lysozyme